MVELRWKKTKKNLLSLVERREVKMTRKLTKSLAKSPKRRVPRSRAMLLAVAISRREQISRRKSHPKK